LLGGFERKIKVRVQNPIKKWEHPKNLKSKKLKLNDIKVTQ